jgi:RimJ/RimL family protein N-acetyltransferase
MTAMWQAPLTGPAFAVMAAIRAAVPVVTTDRLTLRAPRIEDFDAYAAIFTSDRAVFMDGPYDHESAWLDFCEAVASWVLRGVGLYTIARTDTAEVVGFLFLWQEFGDPEPEIGWVLTESAEGKGYATEAAAAVLPMALSQFGPGGLVSYIDDGNVASARVAERLGGTRDLAAEARHGLGCQIWRYGAKGAA